MKKSEKNILWFGEVDKNSIPLVGGKGANLGELVKAKIPVPPGFIVSSKAYFDFLNTGSLKEKMKTELKGLNLDNSRELLAAAEKIKTAIRKAKIGTGLTREVATAYKQLSGVHDILVAVRSSATAEDLPEASFAGQQETFLNVKGEKDVAAAVQKCWASLFEPRAIFYRADKGFGHLKVGIAVIVQAMVESEVSGVMFTVDPLTNDEGVIAIEAAYGLGQAVVSGALTPDQYLVRKSSLGILEKRIVRQDWQLVRRGKVKISPAYQKRQKLSDKLIRELAGIGRQVEAHYHFPQDIEWAYADGELWLVQTRPVTTIKIKNQISKVKSIGVDENLLLEGLGASPGVAAGKVRNIASAKELAKVKKGEVLVTRMTSPDFVPAMRRAVAVVTDEGGRTSHAAIVSRELGIPCVVGTELATKMLKTGEVVTVDGSEGKVYEGEMVIPFISAAAETVPFEGRTATRVYVNLSEPSAAAAVAKRAVDGVGLLRAEFMIAEFGEHPKEVIAKGKAGDFIKRLADGIAVIAEAFYPRPVVYRATDFKTSEYRNLKGGEKFEPEEENPFLGFRGAFRYISDPEVFKMELKAVLEVRNKRNLRNLFLMIPFVRTVEELKEVKKIISTAGLRRSPSFKLWLMAEIPANIILLEEFIKVGIDGISVGSNDLTMLTLGADRDNPRISRDYNEMNPAVLSLIEQAVKTARKHRITSSICGQAPSDYPEMVKKLVEWGVTSVSVNPDVIEKTRRTVYEAEKELVKGAS